MAAALPTHLTPTGGLVQYLRKWAIRAFEFAALRLHAAIRMRFEEAGVCPTVSELMGDEWHSMNHDPTTGKVLDISDGEAGTLVITFGFLEPDDSNHYAHVDYVIDCPPK